MIADYEIGTIQLNAYDVVEWAKPIVLEEAQRTTGLGRV
jgi:hypothetical protein